jgi:gamma-glutamyl-gamma-aminobutyrate hydrolase PuuD
LKIGLTQRILYHNGQAYDSSSLAWYSYLKGHTLVPIANRVDQDFEKLAQDLDAVIITGGDDSALRRTVELKLAGAMTLRRRPIVGVCHGAFLLAEVLGGTIVECIGHHNTEHTVFYFGDQYRVNSYHTLAITRLPERAIALAHDPEGNIEAWIDSNVAGVVWHPERMREPWIPDEINNLLFKL